VHKDKLTNTKLQAVSVTMGEPKHAERYCGILAPSITCLTNETTMPYETYGLQQGKLGELLSPAVVVASVRALARGSSQGEAIGDVKMLPGTFIVDKMGSSSTSTTVTMQRITPRSLISLLPSTH
jgi:hypothetical protein